MSARVALLSRKQVDQLPERAREVVEYRKSGLSQHAQDGVYDRITWNFVRYIWRYRTSMHPRVRQLLSEHGCSTRLVTLTSRRQAARFVTQLRAETSTRGAAP